MTGRIQQSGPARLRLDPIKIRDVNNHAGFEQLVGRLMGGLLAGMFGAKITWDSVPIGPGPGSSNIQMDWVTWMDRTFDYNDSVKSAFLDIEATTHVLDSNEEYVAIKILSLKRLVTGSGGIQTAITAYGAGHPGTPLLASRPVPYLIFVSNQSERLPDESKVRNLLKGSTLPDGAPLTGSDPGIECQRVSGASDSLVVTLANGEKIYVGLVDRQKLIELTYLAIAMDGAQRHMELNERFLHELTSLAGRPLLLEVMPRRIPILNPAAPAAVRLDGRTVTYQRFTIDPYDFLRISTVLRLVGDYAYLQRLPEGPHLEQMAREIEAGGRFPTPVLCIPAEENIIPKGQAYISHAGGAIVSPYQWDIIDGQHRAFSYYFVPPAVGVQSLDVNSYTLASPGDKAIVASALFLNVNFKALRPMIDLALAHYAFASQWPNGVWVQKRSKPTSEADPKLYSSRILASRFLLEMSTRPTLFNSFFKFRGAKDRGKTSIQSISTYLSSDFELRDPSDPKSPMATIFGTVRGAMGLWTSRDAPPESIKKLWAELCDSFGSFLEMVGSGGTRSIVEGRDHLRRLVSRNNNVFVALWRTFYSFSIQGATSPGVLKTIPDARAKKILPWLLAEEAAGRLTGTGNKYKSGSGAISLPNELKKLIGGS